MANNKNRIQGLNESPIVGLNGVPLEPTNMKKEERIKRELRKVITRGEAIELFDFMAPGIVKEQTKFIVETLRTIIVQQHVITKVLLDKNIIKDESELQSYLDAAVDELNQKMAKEDEGSEPKETSSENEPEQEPDQESAPSDNQEA